MNIHATRGNSDTYLTSDSSANVLSEPAGVIYFVRSWNFIKIGFSVDIKTRLLSLQTGSPYEIELLALMPGTPKDEADILGRFSPVRIRGEWFEPHPELMAFISKVRKKKRKLTPPPQSREVA